MLAIMGLRTPFSPSEIAGLAKRAPLLLSRHTLRKIRVNGGKEALTHAPSLPGLTRQSIASNEGFSDGCAGQPRACRIGNQLLR